MSRVQSPVLIGREAELAALGRAFNDGRAGRAGTVVIVGEAGIGKTRLVEEFLRGPVAAADALGLVGGCLDLGSGGVPFAPYLELLRQLRRSLGNDRWLQVAGPVAEALAPLLPVGALAPPSGAVLPDAAEDIRRARLFGGVLDMLVAVAEVQPLAIILEDLHWADRASMELTAFLARNFRSSRITTVLTSRSDEPARDQGLSDLMSMLLREAISERIELRRLTRDEVGLQAESIADGPVPPDQVATLHRRSGGNPFLAEELIALAATGDRTSVPMATRDILLARLAMLSPDAQALVGVAAIGGSAVAIDRLRSAVDLGPDAFQVAMLEAAAQAILIRRPDDDEVEFRHALSREAVVGDLLAGERRRLHGRWAGVLETFAAAEPTLAGEIARHWDGANRADLARAWYLTAAKAAAANLAFDAAATAYERAIDLYRRDPTGPDAQRVPTDVLEQAASAMRFAGRIAEAVALAQEHLEALPASHVLAQALALERLGIYRGELGDNDGALAATAEAVELLRDGPPEAFARSLLSHAICLINFVRLDDVPAIVEQVIEIAVRYDLAAIESMGLCQRGLVRILRGDISGASDDFDRSWDLAIASGDAEAIVLIALDRPYVYDTMGDFERAIDVCFQGIAAVERIGAIGTVDALGMITNAAVWLSLRGRWDEAEEQLRRAQAQDALGRTGNETLLIRARIAAARGRFAEARSLLRQADIGLGPQFDSFHPIIAGELALVAGDATSALEFAMAALGRSAPIGNLTGLLQRAEGAVLGATAAAAVLAARPDVAERRRVRHVVTSLVEAFDDAEASVPGDGWRSGITAWRLELTACTARLDGPNDPEAWAAAAAAWTSSRVPYRAAWSTLRHAEAILDERGDRTVATSLLASALATAVALGADPLRREIEALARRARIDLTDGEEDSVTPKQTSADGRGLTSRELEVLALIVAGRSNREIAETLFISPKTAGAHVGNILGKLGVAGRVQAATMAMRDGLLEK